MSVEKKEDLKALFAVGDSTRATKMVEEWLEVLNAARKRLHLKPITEAAKSSYADKIAAILVQNQFTFFERTWDRDRLTRPIDVPADFAKNFFESLAQVVYSSATLALFSWQPMEHPIGGVAYYKIRHSEEDVVVAAGAIGEMPDLRLDLVIDKINLDETSPEDVDQIQIAEVACSPGKAADVNSMLLRENMDDARALYGSDGPKHLVFCAIEEAFADFERQAIHLAMREPEPEVEDHADIGDEQDGMLAFTRHSYKIHQRTMRGPGNALVMGPEAFVQIKDWKCFAKRKVNAVPVVAPHRVHHVGTLDHKFHVYMDPMLMGKRVLMARVGASIVDQGIVMAPYVLSVAEGKIRLRFGLKGVGPTNFLVIQC